MMVMLTTHNKEYVPDDNAEYILMVDKTEQQSECGRLRWRFAVSISLESLLGTTIRLLWNWCGNWNGDGVLLF
jgi:hypothetical protein